MKHDALELFLLLLTSFSHPAVQAHVQLTDPIEVMGAIRREKDTFKPK